MTGTRLDAALAERGLARSRTHAARLIDDGLVTVDGQPALKAAQRVDDEQTIEVARDDGHVSRAALKLVGALDAFPVSVQGRLALDVGASTGGFTQVLLERGAREVIALDVGHGQLHPILRADPRVRVVEGMNARYLTAPSLAELSDTPEVPELVVGDLSFISLTMVLPALVDTVSTAADLILLIKPQFEVGRAGIREGVVRDPGLRRDAVERVLWAAWDLGLATAGLLPSPIVGSSGNREYLAWFSEASGTNPTRWLDHVRHIE